MKKIILLIYAFFILSCWTHPAFPQNATDTPGITVKADKDAYTVGEKITVTVSGPLPKKATLEWPKKIEELKGLSLITSDLKQGIPFFPKRRFAGRFVFKGYEPGEFEIPSVIIKYSDINGAEKNLTTQKIRITIKSLVKGDVEKLDIKDIKGIYNPVPLRIVLFSLFVLLSLAAWFVYVKITQKPAVAQEAPILLPHAIALEKIRALEQKDLISRGLVGEFYFELSMIVRQYLEARFSLRAPEMTTEEFLASLKDSQSLSLDHKQLLRDFLAHCDMVKFAKYGPQGEEILASLGSAKKLINETAPS